ncbi:helix-turn-helix domain-containing protein [Flavobacterium daemonense]|uniref:helix-turn-helix domain-containing protein n=1 Tax=Flavobacterium daemonense TaxID=1393049 RepID=UPI001184A431|nr:helix-turn-helix transcriptional regulator [Flavobacterium daemonense]KAF2325783.1 helix-turn-helix transcriptional regulator [Flavobacterium daemonense]
MDANKNVFIKFDRISLKSNLVLKELQNDLVTDSTFNLRLIASVHLLISDYLSQMINDTIVIEKVNYTDLMNIITIQNFLFDTVEDFFPSISVLASKAHMSETKFKKLFLKITGITPNAFFTNTKFFRAKELLLEKNYTISEVAEKLNFGSYSYFISTFKKHYGISPLTLVKKHN